MVHSDPNLEEKTSGETVAANISPNESNLKLNEKLEENTYMIRPNYEHKFKKAIVKDIVHKVLEETLDGKVYASDEVGDWTQNISNEVKRQIKELGYERYKIVVQCLIGEQRGEGAKMACRCFWDSDTDNYTQDVYTNSSLFCVTAVFGVFYY